MTCLVLMIFLVRTNKKDTRINCFQMCIIALSLSLSLSFLYQGTVDFNLTAIPCAAKSHVECSLDQLPDSDHHVKLNNLFEKKRMKGWWPVYKLEENGKKTSKVRYI